MWRKELFYKNIFNQRDYSPNSKPMQSHKRGWERNKRRLNSIINNAHSGSLQVLSMLVFKIKSRNSSLFDTMLLRFCQGAFINGNNQLKTTIKNKDSLKWMKIIIKSSINISQQTNKRIYSFLKVIYLQLKN